MLQGAMSQRIAPVLFCMEITLYVLLVLSGTAGLMIFLLRMNAIRKAKGDPAKWFYTLSHK